MAAANDLVFTSDEMAIDNALGYPKAYAKLCKDKSFSPYSKSPPFTFIPYALPQQVVLRSKEFDEMFPIIDPNAKPTAKARIFVSLLWKQLNHLGNAGFDPEIIRVDPYGNVLYYHADSASPLAWNIDHWFPCSRGGLTVPSNLRILQWQVCKKKRNQLEFLIPWWDLQVGLSINQFLSIFASTNSDFRHRAFSWLFAEGENQELNASQTVDSHVFPQHFVESKKKIGLAPAAVVLSRRESYDSVLKSLDINRRPRSTTPIIASKRLTENEEPDMVSNPYQAIVIARDSLKQSEEAAKMQAEIQKLDDEVSELKHKAEEEKVSIQGLELILIKKKRRAEKSRKLAEAQSSHRAILEKMIRDAMHQSVVYKEQVRLNMAASNALMARLEAQRAICDSAEKELYMKFKQRDELEQQISPESEQRRKRSRMDLDLLVKENDDKTSPNSPQVKLNDTSVAEKVLCLSDNDPKNQIHKQLRVFLEEEQKASEEEQETAKEIVQKQLEECGIDAVDIDNEDHSEKTLQDGIKINLKFPAFREPEIIEEDEESRKQRGKGNVEKWLQILLESTNETVEEINNSSTQESNELVDDSTCKYGEKLEETMAMKAKNTQSWNPPPPYKLQQRKSSASVDGVCKEVRLSDSFDRKSGKERKLTRSESARGFRRIPSSPSLIFSGMKKRVDCMGKKPLVTGDNDDADEEERVARKKFIKSSFKSIVKAMKI